MGRSTPTHSRPCIGYVIVTDSRRRSEILFMVDRRRQTKSFWSNRLDDAFVFGDLAAAGHQAEQLRHNNPRVLPLVDAKRIAAAQRHAAGQCRRDADDALIHEIGLDAIEAGWDGHKDAF